ncbi:MAG TPA: MlaD family protein [Gemmatimonadales bacterium]|nr:MlaD family protein [Gemmatimonadales bacterium]
MRPRTADALVGLLVVFAVAVATAALIVTRGWTERRVTIYMLSPSVQDLKADTPVLLQGLNIGEVRSISPQVDSARIGAPEFLVELKIRESYDNGKRIRLPLGTRGEIVSSGLIGSASISLLVPVNDIKAALEPGDTIRGTITQGWTDVLKEVADTLRMQVSDILRDTRKALATVERTASGVDQQVRTIGPEVSQTLAGVQQTMDRLQPTLASANKLLANTDDRMAVLQDSVLQAITAARRMLASADTLTGRLTAMADNLSPEVQQTIVHLRETSAKLDWFIDQVSRRPHRLLTGVRELQAVQEQQRQDSIKAAQSQQSRAP